MHGISGKFPWRSIAAGISLLIGAILLFIGGHSIIVRAAGLAMVLICVNLHRTGRRLSGLPTPSGTMWIAGIVSAAVTLIAFQFLYLDALNGYNDVWPVYAFAFAGVVATGVWGALAARLFQ